MKYSGIYNSKAEPYLSEVIFDAETILNKPKDFLDYAAGAVLKEKSLVIRMDKDISAPEFSRIKRIFNAFSANISFEIPMDENDLRQIMIQNNFPFYYEDILNTFEELIQAIEDGVSQVVISNELGFSAVKVAEVAHARSVKVKAYANILQSNERVSPPEKNFFIRPEDAALYEDYLDFIQLLYNEKTSIMIPKAYAEDHKWFGDLAEIIPNLDENTGLDGRYLIDNFGKKRLNCDKQCIKGGKCNVCSEIAQLAVSLKEKNLYVRRTPKIKTLP